jgi:hypothetical protein
VFSDFRDHVIATQPPITDLLAELAGDAAVYEQMEKLPSHTVEGAFYYRVIRALDSAAVGPFLLWVLRSDEEEMPLPQRYKALRALESWMVRRALCRATAKDVNRQVLELLRAVDKVGPGRAGDAAEALLASQTADSRYWPDDAAVHAALDAEPLYTHLSRPRMRMLLEALEDSMRGPLGEGQQCPRNLTVEHIMPQGWREHWGDISDSDVVAGMLRDRLVQSLGNLTLVNDKLNPALSNRPWTNADAAAHGLPGKGKRDYLLRHSELKLNATVVADHLDQWTEQAIRDRGKALIAGITKIWPRPASVAEPQPIHEIPDREDAVQDEAEEEAEPESGLGHAGKYQALWGWLRQQDRDEIRLTFSEVEQILGMPLPPSARIHLPHWYGYEGTALGRAIRDAGWRATQVNLTAERVVFARESQRTLQASIEGREAHQKEAMNSDWQGAAERAGVAPPVMTVLSSLADAHGLHPCARGHSGEIGMGAAQNAYAAFYVSHRGMTLALDPDQAKALASPLGLALLAKNPTTHYVTCPSNRFSERTFAARVSEAAEAALTRSWHGPRWDRSGTGGASDKLQPTCPIHGYELSATGFCMGCDDQAPIL